MKPISAKQLTVFLAVAALSVGSRILPGAAATANQAGLLLAIAALPIGLLLVWMMGELYKDYPGMGLADIFLRVAGKFFGKIILILIGIIVPFIMLVFTARLHADRFVATVFSDSSNNFFLVLTLLVAFYITRMGITNAVRTGSIFAPVLILVIAGIFLMGLGDFRLGNMWPVSPDDIKPLGLAVPFALIVPVVLILGNLLSDSVSDKQNLMREAIRANIWLCGGLTALIAVCLGLLGSNLTQNSTSPVFAAVKALNVPGIFERVDAFTVVLWIIADLAEIVVLGLIITGTLRKVFKVKTPTLASGVKTAREKFAVPLGILTLAAALGMGASKFKVLWAEKQIFEWVYIAGVLIIFLIIFFLGKIRHIAYNRR